MEESNRFPLGQLLILSLTTFAVILSEMGIPGILPELAEAFDVSLNTAGNFLGYYALSTAVVSIPFTKLLLKVDRKKILLSVFLIYSVGNFMLAATNSYLIGIIIRIIIGAAVGVYWPTIVYYAIYVVSPKYSGRAITITNAGATVGILGGVPLLTTIVQQLSWRVEFLIMGFIGLVITALIFFFLPATPGEEGNEKKVNYVEILKNPAFLKWLLITVLVVLPQYASYVYITQIVEFIQFSPGVAMAQFLYGVGTLLSVIVASIFIDKYFYTVTVGLFVCGGLALLSLYIFEGMPVVSELSFLLWGMSYGAKSAIFQTAISKLFPQATTAANSIQSTLFNFSIMLGSTVGGWILTVFSVPVLIVLPALVLLFVALYTGVGAKRGTLGV